MSYLLPIGERLREERERLGLSQTQFAEIAGVGRKTLFGYESAARAPDGAALSAWASAGADVAYILTGQRSGQPTLTPREEALLDNYRHTDDAGQRIIEGAASAAAQPQQKKA